MHAVVRAWGNNRDIVANLRDNCDVMNLPARWTVSGQRLLSARLEPNARVLYGGKFNLLSVQKKWSIEDSTHKKWATERSYFCILFRTVKD